MYFNVQNMFPKKFTKGVIEVLFVKEKISFYKNEHGAAVVKMVKD